MKGKESMNTQSVQVGEGWSNVGGQCLDSLGGSPLPLFNNMVVILPVEPEVMPAQWGDGKEKPFSCPPGSERKFSNQLVPSNSIRETSSGAQALRQRPLASLSRFSLLSSSL